MSMPAVEMSGTKYGRLLVLERAGSKRGKAAWLCKCDCGKQVVVAGLDLRSGCVKSCRCLLAEFFRTHGLSHSVAYVRYANMLDRCRRKKCRSYKNYGGRGITVCKEWLDFAVFLADMGEPKKGMQLDRIDNDKGYCKENCRWATGVRNCRNQRKTRMMMFEGKRVPVLDVAEKLGMHSTTLKYRLDNGWSDEEAVREAIRKCPVR